MIPLQKFIEMVSKIDLEGIGNAITAVSTLLTALIAFLIYFNSRRGFSVRARMRTIDGKLDAVVIQLTNKTDEVVYPYMAYFKTGRKPADWFPLQVPSLAKLDPRQHTTYYGDASALDDCLALSKRNKLRIKLVVILQDERKVIGKAVWYYRGTGFHPPLNSSSTKAKPKN